MNVKKNRAIVFIACIFLSCMATAGRMLPEKCPSVSVIISEQLDYLVYLFEGWAGIKESSAYDTTNNWTLLHFYPIATQDYQEALTESNNALTLLHYESGPEQGNVDGESVCYYFATDPVLGDFMAVAFTPSIKDGGSLNRVMRRYIQRKSRL